VVGVVEDQIREQVDCHCRWRSGRGFRTASHVGQSHGEGADATGHADDQNPLVGPDPSGVAQGLQCDVAADT
jgi:hypothetical protein